MNPRQLDTKRLIAAVEARKQQIAGLTINPCPFCGSTETTIRLTVGFWSGECLNTGCCAIGPMAGTPEKAADKWNRRQEPAP